MKTYIFILFSLLVLVACGNRKSDAGSNYIPIACTDFIESEDSVSDEYSFGANPTDSVFYSPLKPEIALECDIDYVDTVDFLGYNEEGDYSLLYIKKNQKFFSFYNGVVNEILSRGDIISVTWQMDSVYVAGDGDSLWIVEWVKNVTKIKDGKLSQFRSDNNKIRLTYKYLDGGDMDYYKDDICDLIEYYLANTSNPKLLPLLNKKGGHLEIRIKRSLILDKEYVSAEILDRNTVNTILCISFNSDDWFTIYEYDKGQLIEVFRYTEKEDTN